MPTSLGGPCLVTWSLRASWSPRGKGGPVWGGRGGAAKARLTPGWASRAHFSMLVRPDAPRGLLLFAVPLTASGPSLALFLSHGHLVAQTGGPGLQLRVQSRQRLREGRWHTVREPRGGPGRARGHL